MPQTTGLTLVVLLPQVQHTHFQDALSIADPKSILNVDMNIGVEILHHYWGHNSYASPRTGQ